MFNPPLPSRTRKTARNLRLAQTDAERCLWKQVRGARLDGAKFRRQHPLPPYVVDFCCIERALVVELDGSQHTPAADAARTRALQDAGFRVLRFWDHDVLARTEAVLEQILAAVAVPNPHPNPSPEGRGAETRSEGGRST